MTWFESVALLRLEAGPVRTRTIAAHTGITRTAARRHMLALVDQLVARELSRDVWVLAGYDVTDHVDTRPRCRRCREKWPQRNGVCVACAKALGLPVPTTRDRDAARLARQQAARPAPPVDPPPVPPPNPVRRYDGVEFEIVFGG